MSHTVSLLTRPEAPVSIRTARHLAGVAQFLATHNPGGTYTERGRMTAVLIVTRTAAAASPVLPLVPMPAAPITRAEAALRIAKTAREHGCAWTGDDGEDLNQPAIPKIPGPRPVPDPSPARPVRIPSPRPERALAPRPLPCPDCFGEGGRTVIGGGRTVTETFETCGTCNGTGVR